MKEEQIISEKEKRGLQQMLELANAEKGRLDEQLSLVEKRRGDLETTHNSTSREQAKLNRRWAALQESFWNVFICLCVWLVTKCGMP